MTLLDWSILAIAAAVTFTVAYLVLSALLLLPEDE
jgi:hypothetical protein